MAFYTVYRVRLQNLVCGSSVYPYLSLINHCFLLFSLKLLLLKPVRNTKIPSFSSLPPQRLLNVFKVYWFNCSIWENLRNKFFLRWNMQQEKSACVQAAKASSAIITFFKVYFAKSNCATSKIIMPGQRNPSQLKNKVSEQQMRVIFTTSWQVTDKSSQSASLNLSLSINARGY